MCGGGRGEGGCIPPPGGVFKQLRNPAIVLHKTFGIKKVGDRNFCACVTMPFLTQVGIYRQEFLHENNDHPVSQVLHMQLS